MITVANADAALKGYYLNAICEQLNNNVSPFFSAIEKTSEYVSGKNVVYTYLSGANGGVCALDEDADLPTAHTNRYGTIELPLKNIYGTIEISDKALRASRDSEGGVVNLLNAEMEGLIASGKANLDRMLFATGSGELFYLTTGSGTTYGSTNIKKSHEGMYVDLYDASDRPIAGAENLLVKVADPANKRVIFDRDPGVTIVPGVAYVHNGFRKEISGIRALFRNPVYGHNPTTESFFSPLNVSHDGDITIEALVEMLDTLEETRNSKINMILCSYSMRRAIASLLDDTRRVVNTTDVKAGLGDVFVNNIPVIADKNILEEEIVFINTDDFVLCQMCDWEWLEDEDGKILKQIPGKAAYRATLVKYAELLCRKPYAQGRIIVSP